jgi:arginase family enzyme
VFLSRSPPFGPKKDTNAMRTRILDLDGSLVRQHLLLRRARPEVFSLQDWGPSVRLACSHGSFRRFQDRLAFLADSDRDVTPHLSFLGSGDFHHVTLALLRRLRDPCNLLILDNHPDWMRGIPFLHCGTWLFHAAQLSHVGRIFHIGGDVDFDNAYRWLAPWPMLRSKKIVVSPACRRFAGRRWAEVSQRPLRRRDEEPADFDAITAWLAPFRAELAARPLYISLDKDVLTAPEAVVNWDSGHLSVEEVIDVLRAFLAASEGRVAGMDVVGDWSPVRVTGVLRRVLHWTEHPVLRIDPEQATRRNERVNLLLLDHLPQCGESDPRRGLRVVRDDADAVDADGRLNLPPGRSSAAPVSSPCRAEQTNRRK